MGGGYPVPCHPGHLVSLVLGTHYTASVDAPSGSWSTACCAPVPLLPVALSPLFCCFLCSWSTACCPPLPPSSPLLPLHCTVATAVQLVHRLLPDGMPATHVTHITTEFTGGSPKLKVSLSYVSEGGKELRDCMLAARSRGASKRATHLLPSLHIHTLSLSHTYGPSLGLCSRPSAPRLCLLRCSAPTCSRRWRACGKARARAAMAVSRATHCSAAATAATRTASASCHFHLEGGPGRRYFRGPRPGCFWPSPLRSSSEA